MALDIDTFSDRMKLVGMDLVDFKSYLDHRGIGVDATLKALEQAYPKWDKSKKKGQFNRILHEARKRNKPL
jgi:hypothetical protein